MSRRCRIRPAWNTADHLCLHRLGQPTVDTAIGRRCFWRCPPASEPDVRRLGGTGFSRRPHRPPNMRPDATSTVRCAAGLRSCHSDVSVEQARLASEERTIRGSAGTVGAWTSSSSADMERSRRGCCGCCPQPTCTRADPQGGAGRGPREVAAVPVLGDLEAESRLDPHVKGADPVVFAAGPVRAAAPNASTPSAWVGPSSRPTRRSPSACGEHDDQLDRGRPARGRPRCDTPVPASQNRGRPPPSGQRTGLPDRARQLTETLTPAEFHDRQYPDTLTDEPGTGQVRLPTELGGRGRCPATMSPQSSPKCCRRRTRSASSQSSSPATPPPRRRSSRYSTPPRRVTPNTTVNEPPDDGSSTTTRYAQATQQPTTAPSQQPDALSSAASCLRSHRPCPHR